MTGEDCVRIGQEVRGLRLRSDIDITREINRTDKENSN